MNSLKVKINNQIPNIHSTIDERSSITKINTNTTTITTINYTHDQQVPSDEWVVTHGLQKNPSVSIVDSAGNWVIGDIEYVDLNNIIIRFTFPFSGKAYFN